MSSKDGADVTVPLSIGEWLLSFWPFHLQARQDPDPRRRPLETIVGPGEVIFVPHGYWHMVINLDESIAITQNYVSESNLADVLLFLQKTPEQISGVRDREGEAVKPDELFDRFTELLRTYHPEIIDRVCELFEMKYSDHSKNADMSRLFRKKTKKQQATSTGGVFCFDFSLNS